MKKSSLAFAAVLAAALTLIIWLLGMIKPIQSFENTTLNWRFQLRSSFQKTKPDPRLVLVGVDDQSVRQLGGWPFPRKTHAQLLAFLADEKPAVVTWDILFTEHKENAADDDVMLVEAAKLFPRLISAATKDGDTAIPLDKIGPTEPLSNIKGDISKIPHHETLQLPFGYNPRPDSPPIPSLLQNSFFGFADSESDVDRVRRYLPTLIVYKEKVFPSLALKTLIEFCQAKSSDVAIQLGKEITIPRAGQTPLHIPIDEQGRFLINYRHKAGEFINIGYSGLLYLLNGKLHLEEARAQDTDFDTKLSKLPKLSENIVVIGFNGTGFDSGTTPLDNDVVPLVNLHLNAITNILQQDFLYPSPLAITLVSIFLVFFLLSIVLLRVNLLLILPLGLCTLLAYTAISYALFQFQNLWIPVALPVVGVFFVTLLVTAKRYFGEEAQKRQIKAAMGAYLPEKVMQRVLEHPDQLKLGGDNRELSVLFCDIRGFTKYCDGREPEAVVGVLNEYMEVMSNVIFKYEGTIDKYIGDCIMAFWNAPEDQPDHAQRAVCCAMEMRYALANYKTQRAGIDTEIFECGIGIHTGPALVGNVGSTRRLSYTAIGATVNMAARLESLTKRFTSRIIISEFTRLQIDESQFTLTDLGEVSVPGFAKKIQLWAVEALQDISSALLVGKKVAHQSNVSVADVQQPMWSPAPLPEDAEVDAEGKG